MAGRLLLAFACTAGAVVLTAVALAASGDATAIDGGIAGVATTPPSTDDGLPDLFIERMSIELETRGSCAWLSTKLGVWVEFTNSGTADAGPFVVELNGARQQVDGLAAGVGGSLWYQGYVYNGNQATIDVNNDVVESDESNNMHTKSPPVPTLPPTCTPTATPTNGGPGLPDLIVEAISPRSQASCTVPAGVDVLVKNVGDAAAGASLTWLSADGTGAVGLLMSALDPGESVKLNSTFTGIPSGDRYVAIADYFNVVGESDEGNNLLGEWFSVSTIPTCTPTSAVPCPTHTVPTGNGCASITPTWTPTPTDTPTPPEVLPGDADCDGERTSVDAAVVLQLDAGLVKALDCGEAADVNGDEATNSQDALLILQYVAGLVDSLPP